jgi:hypothetical protein
VLLSLPLAVRASVLKKMFPPFVPTAAENDPNDPEHLVMVLVVAPPINRMVEVPDVPEAVVLNGKGIASTVQTIDGHVVRTIQVN